MEVVLAAVSTLHVTAPQGASFKNTLIDRTGVAEITSQNVLVACAVI